MTSSSPDNRCVQDTCTVDPSDKAEVDGKNMSGKEQSSVPSFKFPFSAETFAPNKTNEKPWHQRGDTSAHEKRIGMAPRGTRRSMGKR
jgi:hypothetical protein